MSAHQDRFGAVSRQIWESAELGYHERNSSALLQNELRSAGFTIEVGSGVCQLLSSRAGGAEWEVFTNVLGNVANAFEDAEVGRQLATSMRESTTPECLAEYYRASESIDLRKLLPQITMPTLVIHEPAFPFGSLDLCQEVAKEIESANFVIVGGKIDQRHRTCWSHLCGRSISTLRERSGASSSNAFATCATDGYRDRTDNVTC